MQNSYAKRSRNYHKLSGRTVNSSKKSSGYILDKLPPAFLKIPPAFSKNWRDFFIITKQLIIKSIKIEIFPKTGLHFPATLIKQIYTSLLIPKSYLQKISYYQIPFTQFQLVNQAQKFSTSKWGTVGLIPPFPKLY